MAGPHLLADGSVSHDYGDAAVLVRLVDDDREDRWRRSQSLGRALRAASPPGFVDVVASIEHVFVSFDPLRTDHAAVRESLDHLLTEPVPPDRKRRQLTIPVVYGGEAGPDLAAVAGLLGLAEDDVVMAHERGPWVVRFVGSPAGAPMLDAAERPVFDRAIPRVASPRARLAPGSVGLSGSQCIVYNAPSPGGWQIIGRTPAQLFDLDTPPHVPYASGDLVRFRAVPASEADRWTGPLV